MGSDIRHDEPLEEAAAAAALTGSPDVRGDDAGGDAPPAHPRSRSTWTAPRSTARCAT